MKRALIILLVGLGLGLLAGTGIYFTRTASHRAMLCCERPELAWLQHEFKLSDEEFARVSKLHDAYLTNCSAMCARIAATNELVREQVARDGAVTPAVEKLLADAGQLRLECQKQMLGHFMEVSRTMPPEQGRRYLDWVEERVFSMSHEPLAQGESGSHHGH